MTYQDMMLCRLCDDVLWTGYWYTRRERLGFSCLLGARPVSPGWGLAQRGLSLFAHLEAAMSLGGWQTNGLLSGEEGI